MKQPEVQIHVVDLSKSTDELNDHKIFKKALRKLKITSSAYLLVGINAENIDTVIEQGIHDIHKRYTFAIHADAFMADPDTDCTPLEYALRHQESAVVVYDSSRFTDSMRAIGEYELLKDSSFREAIVALFRISK